MQGGQVYCLGRHGDKVYRVNVNVAYNAWKTTDLSIVETITMKYRSFKWSNDHQNGNIGGDTEVFGGYAHESSPSVFASGVPCDIVETKGPTTSCDLAQTANTHSDVAPDKFDTRLWVQFRPPNDDDSFTEGDRFLFCGKTENTIGSKLLYMADRTPPTTTLFGTPKWSYGGGLFGNFKMQAGMPGVHATNNDIGGNGKAKGRSALFHTDDNHNCSVFAPYDSFDFTTERPKKDQGKYMKSAGTTKFPYVSMGYNVGWDCSAKDEKVAIKVARYGLFPISDNDGDGILDGLGVSVPSTDYSVTSGSNKFKKWGNLHQRVSAHAVGLLAESDVPWMRHGGRWSGYIQKYFSMASNSNGSPTSLASYSEDAPEHMKVNKFIFTAADMHFGDMPQDRKIEITAVEQNGDPGGAGADYYTRITTDGAHNLQAGDLVYFHGGGDWVGWNYSWPVVATDTDANNKFWVGVKSDTLGDDAGHVFYGGYKFNKKMMLTVGYNMQTNTPSFTYKAYPENTGRFDYNHFHYAYNTSDGANGSIFNSHGHFGHTWYTDQMNIGALTNSNTWPAIQPKLERLNWLAGFTMRPFDMDDKSFIDLVLGKAISIDLPSTPSPVPRIGTKTVQSDSSTDDGFIMNSMSNKLFMTNPGKVTPMGDGDDVKLFQINWNFLYPNENSYLPVETGLIRWRRKTGRWKWRVYYVEREYNTDDVNGRPGWEISFAGYLSAVQLTTATTASKFWEWNALYQPAIKLNMATLTYNSALMTKSVYLEQNILAGLAITVVDKDTGVSQTRKIVGSYAEGTDVWVTLNKPFSHAPVATDGFYVWKTSLLATAPVRMMKSFETRHDGPVLYNKGPLVQKEMYQDGGTCNIINGQVTCTEHHGLTNTDKVVISDSDSYNGTHEVTVKSNLIFNITTGTTTENDARWDHISNSKASSANPIEAPLLAPAIKLMYGDLDMRRLREVALIGPTYIANNGDEIDLNVGANHVFQQGEQIILNNAEAEQKGTYLIDDKDTNEIQVDNLNHTNTGSTKVYSDGWGGLAAASTGASVVGEIGCNFYQWDKGDRWGNVLRHDADDDTRYTNITEASFKLSSSSPSNQPNDFFLKNQPYRYKVSLIYDGYQEGPLSEGSWIFEDSGTRASLDVTINVKDYSRRLSAICVYRKDTVESFYRLVKQVPTSDEWAKNDTSYSYTFIDDGKVFGSYEARTGISEINNDLSIKYGFATELAGYLFAGDCAHKQIKNARNLIFRSKPGMFSIFDWASDFVQLKAPPTAMIGFLGKLWVFDANNIFKINPINLAIEDVFEGIGCSSSNSVIATEYGMFFANRSGAYFHDGSAPKKISSSIQQGGETNMLTISSSSTSETTNVEDLSWNNTAGNLENKSPYVTYDSKRNAVYFLVEFKDNDGLLNKRKTYVWVYSIDKNRWDLWSLAENDDVGKPFLGKNGEIYVGIGNGLFEITGGASNKKYNWLSKKFVMNAPSIKKVFTKVKINGTNKPLNVGDDKLIVATDTGRVTSSNIVYKSTGNDSADYRLKTGNKTGKWCQFKLEDMEAELDSVAIIYRLRSVK